MLLRVPEVGPRRYAVELRFARRRPLGVGRCGIHCEPVSVKGGLALWQVKHPRIDGYAIRAQRRFRWRIPDDSTVLGSTSTHVYYRTPARGEQGPVTLKAFRWRP
jgi:hypothetical protein